MNGCVASAVLAVADCVLRTFGGVGPARRPDLGSRKTELTCCPRAATMLGEPACATGGPVCRRKSNRESARRSRQRRMQEAKECEDRIAALNQNSLQLARQVDEARHNAASAAAALSRTQAARDLSANAVRPFYPPCLVLQALLRLSEPYLASDSAHYALGGVHEALVVEHPSLDLHRAAVLCRPYDLVASHLWKLDNENNFCFYQIGAGGPTQPCSGRKPADGPIPR